MVRRLRIEWQAGDKVTALLDVARSPAAPAVLLAHGGGVGQRHPFMEGLRIRLAAAGLTVMTFDYPYMEAGRRAPDRIERLLACHRAAADRLSEYADRIVLGGKSMGGRMATHLGAERGVAGIVVYGYPLVPLGKTQPRSTQHFDDVTAPMLFIQGSRDRLGPPGLFEPIVAGLDRLEMVVIDDADHGFSVPKRTGLDAEQVLDRLSDETVQFIGRI